MRMCLILLVLFNLCIFADAPEEAQQQFFDSLVNEEQPTRNIDNFSAQNNTNLIDEANDPEGPAIGQINTEEFSLNDFEKLFPQSEMPDKVDLNIKFDDRVVTSFSDHLVVKKDNIIKDMRYSITENKFRVTVLLYFDKIKNIEFKGGVLLGNVVQPSSVDKGEDDQFIFAVDVDFDIFNRQDKQNEICLTFKHINIYHYWEKGNGRKSNSDIFNEWYDASEMGVTADNIEEKLEEASDEDELKLLRAQNSLLKAKAFKLNLEPSPILIGNILNILQTKEMFNRFLNFEHFYGTSENDHLNVIVVSQLDKSLEMAIPDFAINFVNIVNRQLVFTGKVVK